jgi:hypothetical protein
MVFAAGLTSARELAFGTGMLPVAGEVAAWPWLGACAAWLVWLAWLVWVACA